MTVTHAKVSAVPDGADATLVLPSDWNDDHVVAIAHGDVSDIGADDHHAQSHTQSDHTGTGATSTQAFGDAATAGVGTKPANIDHKHAMPADPVTAHVAALDPHTGYRLEADNHTHASSGAQGGTIDHGALTGLSDDDHPQYATDTDLTTHAGAADPHTGYRLESADHSHATTGLQGGQIDHGAALSGLSDDDHPQYLLKTLWDAKGDLISASADNAPAKVTVGADDTILMADAAQAAGLKWVASATPSTQAFADAAAVGTTDTFTRGDHKHAMPTLGYGHTGNSAPAVSLTTASAFATATTSVSAATYADVTGVSVSLVAGTWLVIANVYGSSVNAQALMHVAITDNANAIVAEGSQGIGASGTANVAQLGNCTVAAFVTPGSTTTYKVRAARGLTTLTGTWVAMDGAGTNTTNNLTDGSDKGTGMFAVRIA